MKYLDERIELTVKGFLIERLQAYKYTIFDGTDAIFSGTTYIPLYKNTKTFDITDIVANYVYLNPYFSNINNKLIRSYHIELVVGSRTYTSETEDVYLAYRYPHYLKRLEPTKSTNIFSMLQGGLLPIYPAVDTNEYKFNTSLYIDDTANHNYYAYFTQAGKSTKPMKMDGGAISYSTELSNLSSMQTTTSGQELYEIEDYDFASADDESHTRINQSYNSSIDFDLGSDRMYFNFGIWTSVGGGFKEFGDFDGKLYEEGEKIHRTYIFDTFDEIPAGALSRFEFHINDTLGSMDNVIWFPNLTRNTYYTIEFDVTVTDKSSSRIIIENIRLARLGSLNTNDLNLVLVDVQGQNWTPEIIALPAASNLCDNLDGYYLQWQDRLGGVQSQHFAGTNTFSTNYDTQTIITYKGEKNIISKNVKSKWIINSDWIDEDVYPNYESIFTSKYLKLYDVKEDKLYDVVITGNDYTEKTFKNQGRNLFNLRLELEKSNTQNITY